MPDIEMMQILGQLFNVSVNELLAGQELMDEEFRRSADENILDVLKQSAFSFEEKRQFWKNKWRKEHIGLFVLMGLLDIAYLTVCIVMNKETLIGLLGIIILVEYAWQNNKMMIYVENNLYGRKYSD